MKNNLNKIKWIDFKVTVCFDKCVQQSNYHPNQDIEYFDHSRKFPCAHFKSILSQKQTLFWFYSFLESILSKLISKCSHFKCTDKWALTNVHACVTNTPMKISNISITSDIPSFCSQSLLPWPWTTIDLLSVIID